MWQNVICIVPGKELQDTQHFSISILLFTSVVFTLIRKTYINWLTGQKGMKEKTTDLQ